MNLAISGKGGTGKTYISVLTLMNRINDYPLIYTQPPEYYRARGIDPDHTYLAQGVPGVLFVSYTNPAVNVLRRSIDTSELVMSYIDPMTQQHTLRQVRPADLAMTVNKLLQFRPADTETAAGLGISTGAFYPYRDAVNKLPPEITTIVLDEVGLLEIGLTLKLLAACEPRRIQFIFIGDICQTGASYGPSTLIRALIKLPRISFDKTYRFSGELLAFADEINEGDVKGITGDQLLRTSESSSGDKDIINLGFFSPAEEASAEKAMARITKALYILVSKGIMCLYTDLFIIPQKTQELSGNNIMGSLFSLLDRGYGRPTFYLNTNAEPIILAVGDAILYDNKVGIVLDIGKNESYVGNHPQEHMYVSTRDYETWGILYDKDHQSTVDSIVTQHKGCMASQAIDEIVTQPMSTDDLLAELAHGSLGGGLGDISFLNDEDDEDKKTRQLTNCMIILDVTGIDSGFVSHTPKSADATYKAFTKELVDNCLFLHNGKQAGGNTPINKIDDLENINELVQSLVNKYSINPNDVKVQFVQQTSQLSSRGVKYNWRTVQQTQGSQSYSTFCCFHRKCHVPGLVARENLYTAMTRSMSKSYGLMSKRLLDGTLSAGGINSQRYPGQTVEQKLKNYIRRTRTVGVDEIALDKQLDNLLQINKVRADYYAKNNKNLLLDGSKDNEPKDIIDSLDISREDIDEQPF